jgi:hypothetical protein
VDDVLGRRVLAGFDRRWPAIEAAGGLYVAPANASAGKLRHAVEAVGTRALELRTGDLTVLEGIHLEYLFVAAPVTDVRPLEGLPALKGLSLESWRGDLDLSRLPALDWFGALEVKPGQVEVLLSAGHPRLTWLALGRYRNDDLTPLGRLPALTTLWVGETRTLATVDGVADLRQLRSLTLSRCVRLGTLSGVERSPSLQAVVVDSCPRVQALDPLADVAGLRLVQIESRNPPSLEPLIGHPRLEFAWLIGGGPPAAEVDALLGNPSLRLLVTRRATWLRDRDGWTSVDMYAMTPEQQDTYDRLMADLNRAKDPY